MHTENGEKKIMELGPNEIPMLIFACRLISEHYKGLAEAMREEFEPNKKPDDQPDTKQESDDHG